MAATKHLEKAASRKFESGENISPTRTTKSAAKAAITTKIQDTGNKGKCHGLVRKPNKLRILLEPCQNIEEIMFKNRIEKTMAYST